MGVLVSFCSIVIPKQWKNWKLTAQKEGCKVLRCIHRKLCRSQNYSLTLTPRSQGHNFILRYIIKIILFLHMENFNCCKRKTIYICKKKYLAENVFATKEPEISTRSLWSKKLMKKLKFSLGNGHILKKFSFLFFVGNSSFWAALMSAGFSECCALKSRECSCRDSVPLNSILLQTHQYSISFS